MTKNNAFLSALGTGNSVLKYTSVLIQSPSKIKAHNSVPFFFNVSTADHIRRCFLHLRFTSAKTFPTSLKRCATVSFS